MSLTLKRNLSALNKGYPHPDKTIIKNVSPSFSAEKNTASLQQALDNAGMLYLPEMGTYEINDTLTIYSNTVLDLNGATIKAEAGMEKYMIINDDSSVSVTSITNSGTTATVTITAHGYDLYQPVQIEGATGGDAAIYNGHHIITSVPTANTFTYEMYSTPGGSATGTITCKANQDIEIRNGTIDYNYPANSGTIGSGDKAVVLENVRGVKFFNLRGLNTRKFAFTCANCTFVNATKIDFDTDSDGLHFFGPLRFCTVRDVTGITGDDVVAFTAGGYLTHRISEGPMTDITVDNIQAANTAGSLIKITGDDEDYYFDAVVIRNLYGAPTAAAVAIVTDTADLQYTYVKNMTIDGISLSSIPTNVIALGHSSTLGNVLKVDNLTIRHVSSELASDAGRALLGIFLDANTTTTLGTIKLESCRAWGGANARMVIWNASNADGKIYLDKCEASDINNMMECKTTSDFGGAAYITSCRFDGSSALFVPRGYDWDIHVSQTYCAGGNPWFLSSSDTGVTYNVRGDVESTGVVFNTNAAGSPILNLYGFGLSADMDKAKQTAGTFFYNTDSGKGTGIGHVVGDGSAFTNIADGTTEP